MSLTAAIRKELENAREAAEELKKDAARLKSAAQFSTRLADLDDVDVKVERTTDRAAGIKAVAQKHQAVLEQALQSAKDGHRKAVELEQKLAAAQKDRDLAQGRLEEFGDGAVLSRQLSSVKDVVGALEREKTAKAVAKNKAMAEFEAAKKAFSAAEASNATEQCKYFNWPKRWASAELEAAAARHSEEAKSRFEEAEEELSGADAELAAKRNELKLLKQRVTDRVRAAQDLESAEQRVQKLVQATGDAPAKEAAAEVHALKGLAETGAMADSALKIANEARAAAFNHFKKYGQPVDKQMLQATDDGTIFNAPQGSPRANAIADFRAGGRGTAAKRLAAALGSAPSSAAFLEVMAKEQPAPIKRDINVPPKKGGGGPATQEMQKWVYADGTVVRYKPLGDLYSGGKPTYSIEVQTDIGAPESDANIACKVDPRGRAVPKDPDDLRNPFQDPEQEKSFRNGVMKLGHRRLGP